VMVSMWNLVLLLCDIFVYCELVCMNEMVFSSLFVLLMVMSSLLCLVWLVVW